jgi:hypothetical protein
MFQLEHFKMETVSRKRSLLPFVGDAKRGVGRSSFVAQALYGVQLGGAGGGDGAEDYADQG